MSYRYVDQVGLCVECRVEFPKTASTKIRCSACQIENRQRQHKEKMKSKGAQYAAAHAATRALRLGTKVLSEPVQCGRCDIPFVRRSPYARFCDKCRAEGKWARANPAQRAAIRAKRRAARIVRQKTDPAFVLNKRMSAGVRHSLNTVKGGRSWEVLVGYTTADLMRHLERQFLPGMSWENRSTWHVDHILPLYIFDYQTPDDPNFRAAWALTNLRPLWALDNIKKNATRTHLI